MPIPRFRIRTLMIAVAVVAVAVAVARCSIEMDQLNSPRAQRVSDWHRAMLKKREIAQMYPWLPPEPDPPEPE